MNQYFGMVTSLTFVPHVPAMTTVPISLRLREHHCINPESPIAPGGSSLDALDDGLCSGWFPADVNIRETSEGVKIDDPRYGGSSSYYERYREGKGNSHNEDTCLQCKYRREQEQLDLEIRVRENERDSQERDDKDGGRNNETNEDSSEDSGDERRDRLRERLRRLKQLPRSPSATRRQRHSDAQHEAPRPGVTRPDGPSSGVDPTDVRMEFQEVMGPDIDIDALLDAELHSEDDAESDWEEYVENTCNGIQDIVITGEVCGLIFKL